MDQHWRNPESKESSHSASSRRRKAREIASWVLEQREEGLGIRDSEVLAKNPDITDELQVELRIAAQIRLARICAENSPPPNDPLPSRSDSEIDKLLNVTTGDEDEDEHFWPRVPGYLISKFVGHGSQGSVFQATQESTGRTVAIKVLSGGPFIPSRQRKRFHRETNILASLNHPNVVSIVHQGRTADGSFFFVMDYVDGIPLDEYCRENVKGSIDGTRDLIRLFAKIAKAVAAAHVLGVVHRDLKPRNIPVDRNGEPRILDFGMARISRRDVPLCVESITDSGQIIGSLPWASPEQASGLGEQLTPSSDVYALGIMLYESLTGHPPYLNEGPIDELILRIRNSAVLPPSKRASGRYGLGGSLDSIVLRCLEKSPADRYESADSLATDLEAWLDGKPVLAKRLKHDQRKPKRILGAMLITSLAMVYPIWRYAINVPPSVIQLPRFENSLGMELVEIPAGGVVVGSPEYELGRYPDEHQRYVHIDKPFFIGVTDVTQDQYQRVMHVNPSDPRWQGMNLPVQDVSWNEAMKFCLRLSAIEHRNYRLPTDIEWEYACRAGSLSAFIDGAEPTQVGWYFENAHAVIHPVAQKVPNPWGLFDMHGNVSQWCADAVPRITDMDTADGQPILRVIRGGNADVPQVKCRSASRFSHKQDDGDPYIGFRVVCEN